MVLPLIVGPLYMLVAVAIVAVLFWKKGMSERAAQIVLAASVVVAGFLQWGFLDTTSTCTRYCTASLTAASTPHRRSK